MVRLGLGCLPNCRQSVFGKTEVGRARDFQVGRVTGNQTDWVAEQFDGGGIVGDPKSLGDHARIRAANHIRAKGLWRLGAPELISWNGSIDGPVGGGFLDRVRDGSGSDGGAVFFGGCDGAMDERGSHARARSIVDGNDSRPRRAGLDAMPDRVLAFGTADCDCDSRRMLCETRGAKQARESFSPLSIDHQNDMMKETAAEECMERVRDDR